MERSLGERRNGAVIVGPPKTGAGVRTVHMPPSAIQVLQGHLSSFVCAAAAAPLFVGRTGLALRPQGLEEAWRSAREEVECPARRSGCPPCVSTIWRFAGTMAAAGASTKEVMARADGPPADGTSLRARHPRA